MHCTLQTCYLLKTTLEMNALQTCYLLKKAMNALQTCNLLKKALAMNAFKLVIYWRKHNECIADLLSSEESIRNECIPTCYLLKKALEMNALQTCYTEEGIRNECIQTCYTEEGIEKI